MTLLGMGFASVPMQGQNRLNFYYSFNTLIPFTDKYHEISEDFRMVFFIVTQLVVDQN
jgi:hypothetical protein